MTAVHLNHFELISALGFGRQEHYKNFLSWQAPNLYRTEDYSPGKIYPLGKIQSKDPIPLPDLQTFAPRFRSRNNQILMVLLNEMQNVIRAEIGNIEKHRIAVVIGTSTSGIESAEQAYLNRSESGQLPETFQYAQQEIFSPAAFLANKLDITGPCYTISTACSSGAKALASGKRLLELDLCDVVIAGGIDTLCQLTVQGFASLEALSPDICLPFSKNRRGINIGEGGALFVMSRHAKKTQDNQSIKLLGVGEASDAHHISAPDPSGQGALNTMSKALNQAQLKTSDIDYLNLHGTATEQNDAMESKAVYTLFKDQVACSSTKPMIGHCLGAAGALEAALCCLMIQANTDETLPGHFWDGEKDPKLAPIQLLRSNQLKTREVKRILSNSFAFGGSNISLLLSA